jgi:hypothetical protein
MVKYIPLYFDTYNLHYSYASTLTIVIFGIFFFFLFSVLSYEYDNKRNVCHPNFYYSKGCRNLISSTVTSDPDFLNQKNNFYSKMRLITETIKKDDTTISSIDASNESILQKNANYFQNTIKQVQDLTDVLKTLSIRYLGELDTSLKNSPDNANKMFVEQRKKIEPLLITLKDTIQKTVIDPTYIRYVDPLEKIYKSLANITPNVTTLSNPSVFSTPSAFSSPSSSPSY